MTEVAKDVEGAFAAKESMLHVTKAIPERSELHVTEGAPDAEGASEKERIFHVTDAITEGSVVQLTEAPSRQREVSNGTHAACDRRDHRGEACGM